MREKAKKRKLKNEELREETKRTKLENKELLLKLKKRRERYRDDDFIDDDTDEDFDPEDEDGSYESDEDEDGVPTPEETVETPKEELVCTICISPVVDSEVKVVLANCNHTFHWSCISGLFESCNLCPNCREYQDISKFQTLEDCPDYNEPPEGPVDIPEEWYPPSHTSTTYHPSSPSYSPTSPSPSSVE